jgi:NAD(P)-dependent dehydrogenase (short-subunit alcohol dehydrogenase family)
MFDYEGKHVVVTGASRGMGAEVARRFVESGADVTISSRTEPRYEHARLVSVPADITTADGAQVFARRVLERREGRVDLVVDNLGSSGGIRGSVLEVSDDQWLAALGVNLLSAARLDRLLAPTMKAAASGCIIHLSSTVRRHPLPEMIPYAAAKAALVTYSRGLALALAGDGIRVCSISPGFVDTEAFRSFRDQMSASPESVLMVAPGAIVPQSSMSIPLGRLGTPGDIAALILFLASDAADWITGCDFVVDGGLFGSL